MRTARLGRRNKMSTQAVEVEPTKGCRICGQTDGTATLTAYILCLEHRQLALLAPSLRAQNRTLLAALESILAHVEDADVERLGTGQCTLCHSFRDLARAAIASVEVKA